MNPFAPPASPLAIIFWLTLILGAVFGLTRAWGWWFDKPAGPFERDDK